MPIEKVWNAWTSKEQTESWLAPGANIQFEEGGPYEFFWNENPEVDSTLGCKLLSIKPHQYLHFEWQGKREFLHMFQLPEGRRTTVEVHFSPTSNGVRIAVVQNETRDLPEWKEYDTWMAAAWKMALESLKNHCEGSQARPYWEE